MTRDDINRWEAEIESWRQRYEALLKLMADQQAIRPPLMMTYKESYELGRLHGAAAEREACAKVCENMRPSKREHDSRFFDGCTESAAAIRARSNP